MNKNLLFAPASLLALNASLVQVHAAQVDYFLKLDGVTGESHDDKHKGWIQLDSFSWGVERTTIGSATGGGGAGKVAVHDISVTKTSDSTSPLLALACADGKHIRSAIIEVVSHELKLDYKEQTPTVVLRLTLEQVLVSSEALNGHKADVPTESLSLNFAKVQITDPQAPTDTNPVIINPNPLLIDDVADGN